MTNMNKSILLLIFAISNIASAHFKETIGYEFEDYNLQVLQRMSDKGMRLGALYFLGFDIRQGYDDCEFRSIPLKINEIKDHFSTVFFRDVAAFYDKLRTDISENNFIKHEQVSLFSAHTYHTFGSYPKLLTLHKGDKTAGDPYFDIGPQVTFSLDIRKVWNLLNRSFLNSYLDSNSRNNAAMSVYAIGSKDKIYLEFVRSAEDLEVLKGFVALGLFYISDYLKIAGKKEQVSKFKHPLFLKTSFPKYYALVLEKLDKSKLDKLRETISADVKEYIRVRFRGESLATKLQFEEFCNEVFHYWMDLNRKEVFTTKTFYDQKIASFSDFPERHENVWDKSNHNQYIYFEMRNLRKIFAQQNYTEKKFPSADEMYKHYAMSEKDAILLAKDFTEKLIQFHGEQKILSDQH